jgi:hypothetical protein
MCTGMPPEKKCKNLVNEGNYLFKMKTGGQFLFDSGSP